MSPEVLPTLGICFLPLLGSWVQEGNLRILSSPEAGPLSLGEGLNQAPPEAAQCPPQTRDRAYDYVCGDCNCSCPRNRPG